MPDALFKVGQRIRNRETGRVSTVTAVNPSCGNVYIGDHKEEISPIAFTLVPDDAGTQEPAPEPVAVPAGDPQPVASNGHSNGDSNAEGRVRRIFGLGREKERV